MEDNQVMVLLESVDSKMQLVLEAFSVLDKKIDDVKQHLTERAHLTDFKIDVLNKKIDTVSIDLKAHRKDTEAHSGLYVVREG
jgi:ribosomal protein S15P/S13E